MSIDSTNAHLMADAIKNTVTPEDVTVVAQKYAKDKSIRVLEHYIGDYSKEKLGFTTAHKILNIKFQRSNASETESASFFVKSVPYDVQVQVDFLVGAGVFSKESSIFRQVIPRLIENCKCEPWYPECYSAKEDAIVLEDLKSRGYKVIDTDDNVVALKSALVSIARLHGSSMLMEDRLNRNSNSQITLNEYFSGVFHETIFNPTGVIAACLSSTFDVTCALAKSFGHDPGKLRKNFDRIHEMVEQSETHRNVLCHGDLWRNNLMFDDNYKCVLVDFQHARYAPLVTDLLQFLHLNATRSFRDKYEGELVGFYQSALDEMIRDNDATGGVKAPTTAEISAGMEDLRMVGLVTACTYFPVSLIDPKTIARYGEDPDAYKIFLLGDKKDLVMAYMKINEDYKSRLQAAVVELAEYIDLVYK